MNSIPEDQQLFSRDVLKEVVDSEDAIDILLFKLEQQADRTGLDMIVPKEELGEVRLAVGQEGELIVKEEAIDAPLIKRMWGFGSCAKEEDQEERGSHVDGDNFMSQDSFEKNCPVDGCFEKFPSFADLVQHMRIHPKPLLCSFCQKSFAHPSILRRHYATHTGEKNFECDTCQKRFGRTNELKVHQRTHTGERPYGCEFCDYKAATSCHLKIHLRRHTKEKPFPCLFCDKAFSTSSQLKLHVRTHTGERPFECETCGYRAARASHLKSHQRIHTRELLFFCDVCGLMMASHSNLKAYKRTHTGEKPFSCATCGQKTAQRSNLKTHQKKYKH